MGEQRIKCLHESDKKNYSVGYEDMSTRFNISETGNN